MDTPKIVPAAANGAHGTWDQNVEKAPTEPYNINATHRVDEKSPTETYDINASGQQKWQAGKGRAVAGARQAFDRLSGTASQAAATLSEKAGQLRDVQDQVVADTRVRVREKPVTALAIAVAAGFLLSRLLRR